MRIDGALDQYHLHAAVGVEEQFRAIQGVGTTLGHGESRQGGGERREEAVKLALSDEVKALIAANSGDAQPVTAKEDKSGYQQYPERDGRGTEDSGGGAEKDADGLSESERESLRELEARDTEVRAHEQAHAAAAGPYLRGGPYYQYQMGPDGRMFAVGGHVDLDVGKEADPRDTIRKAHTVRAAAMAPGSPSGSDHAIASSSAAMEAEARREMVERESRQADDGEPRSDGRQVDKMRQAYSRYEEIPLTGVIINAFG